jgi:hypothetical protein
MARLTSRAIFGANFWLREHRVPAATSRAKMSGFSAPGTVESAVMVRPIVPVRYFRNSSRAF